MFLKKLSCIILGNDGLWQHILWHLTSLHSTLQFSYRRAHRTKLYLESTENTNITSYMWKDCFSSLILKLCDELMKADDFWNHFAFDDPCFAALSQVSQQPCSSYRDDLCIQQRLWEMQLLYQQHSFLDLYIPICFPCIHFDFLQWPVSLHGEQMWHFSHVCLMSTNLSPSHFLHSLFLSVSLLMFLSVAPGWIKDPHTHAHTHTQWINTSKCPTKQPLTAQEGGRQDEREGWIGKQGLLAIRSEGKAEEEKQSCSEECM